MGVNIDSAAERPPVSGLAHLEEKLKGASSSPPPAPAPEQLCPDTQGRRWRKPFACCRPGLEGQAWLHAENFGFSELYRTDSRPAGPGSFGRPPRDLEKSGRGSAKARRQSTGKAGPSAGIPHRGAVLSPSCHEASQFLTLGSVFVERRRGGRRQPVLGQSRCPSPPALPFHPPPLPLFRSARPNLRPPFLKNRLQTGT